MNYLGHQIKPHIVPSLYLVSFDDWGYDQYDSFLVVACSEEEANMLTPSKDVNYNIGINLGYDCPKPDLEEVKDYRDYYCGEGKSIIRLGDPCVDLEWGDVPIASYNAG